MEQGKVKSTLVGTIALLLAVVSIQSHAEDSWYMGVHASQVFVDEPGLDEDDLGAKIFGGYKFNDHFAVEGGYYDFVEIDDGGSRFDIDGVSLAAVGLFPLSSQVSLFGRFGIHDWDVDINGPISAQLTTASDTDTFYGVGLDYAVNDRWSVRGEIERIEVEDLDLDVVSIGVVFKF